MMALTSKTLQEQVITLTATVDQLQQELAREQATSGAMWFAVLALGVITILVIRHGK